MDLACNTSVSAPDLGTAPCLLQPAASFGDLPTDLQSLVFAYSAAPLQTCRSSAAVARSPQLVATWLLNSGQEFPLLTAARHKHWDACLIILDSQAERSAHELGDTLGWASMAGESRVVEQLLTRGAEHGYALALAAKQGHLPVMQLLIQHGADLHYECFSHYGHGQALTTAIKHGQLEAVQLLLQAGVEAGEEALVQAAGLEDSRIVQLLLDHGIRDTKDRAMIAAAMSSHQCWPVTELLLNSRPDEGNSHLGSRLGMALVAAAGSCNLRMVKHLLRYQQQVMPQISQPVLISQADLNKALCAGASRGRGSFTHPQFGWAVQFLSTRWQPGVDYDIIRVLAKKGAVISRADHDVDHFPRDMQCLLLRCGAFTS